MKVAFASEKGEDVDQHFGWCHNFMIYDVTPGGYDALGMREIPEMDEDGAEYEVGKIDRRIDVIEDCTILYCMQIGPTAAARVVKRRIHPMKVNEPEKISVILDKLVETLKKPPIWLRKVLESEK